MAPVGYLLTSFGPTLSSRMSFVQSFAVLKLAANLSNDLPKDVRISRHASVSPSHVLTVLRGARVTAFPLSSHHFWRFLSAPGAARAMPPNHIPAANVSINFANLLSLPHIIASIPQNTPTNNPAVSNGFIFARVPIASLLKSLFKVSADCPLAFSIALST